MADLAWAQAFPQSFEAFRATMESGNGGYGTPLDPPAIEFYVDGHPFVDRCFRASYQLVGVEEIPVDKSPERRESWAARNHQPEVRRG